MKTSKLNKAQEVLLFLIFILFANAIAIAQTKAAQTANSHAAQVHEHLQKAAEYLKANDANSAIQEFNAVLALDPKNTDAYTNLGIIGYFQRDYPGAAKNLHKALAIQPTLVKAQAMLGLCEKRMGDAGAKALLEKSFAKLKDLPLRVQVGMALADLDEQQGDTGGTVAVMKTLVDIAPDNIDVLFMAQRVYSELADDTLNKLAILAPGSARMQLVIAEHLINAGDLHKAIEHYQKALEIDPRLPGAHFELGEAILQSSPSNPEVQAQAQKEFEAALASDGDSAKVEDALASIAMSQSDSGKANSYYQRAYQLDPHDVQAQLGLAKIAMDQEKPQEAIKLLRAAVESDPLNGETHYRLGLAYRNLKMNDDAAKEMRLFREIKQAKDKVKVLYRQMNRNVDSLNDDSSEQGEDK